MGSLFKGKSQTSTSSSTSEPWKPAQNNLKDILGDISNWYDSAQNTGYISPTGDLSSIYSQYLNGLNSSASGINDTTNSLLNQGMSSTGDVLSGYNNIAGGSLNYSTGDIANAAGSLYNSDLVQKQIDAANRGIQQNLTEQQFTGIDRNAVGSGNLGSSRAGVAQAIAARDATQMMTDNANTITGNAYNQAINTAANTLQNNVGTQLQGIAGSGNAANTIYNQGATYSQNALSGLNGYLSSAQLQQMLQGQQQTDAIGNRDYLANLISQYYLPVSSNIAGLGGQTNNSQTTPGTSMFSSLISGAQTAGGAAQSFGSAYNSFSDKRLKKNIEYIGMEGGHKVYTWEWTKKGKEIAGSQPNRGVLAQEVMITHPDAVTRDEATGFLKVDYSKL